MPIRIGAFDESTDLAPQVHLYVSSARPWHRFALLREDATATLTRTGARASGAANAQAESPSPPYLFV